MSKRNNFITPDFFSVAPELIGLPLAAPARRGVAMAIDGILVAILVQAGGVFLGLAAVFVLLRASRPTDKQGKLRDSVRLVLRLSAALVVFVLIVQGSRRIFEKETDEVRVTSTDESSTGDLNLNFPPGEGIAVAASVTGLMRADDPSEVAENAGKLLDSAKRAGATDRQLREARTELINLMGDDADSANTAALDSVLNAIAGQAPVHETPQDSLQTLVTELRNDVSRLDQRGDSLAAALENAHESRGLRTYLSGLFDDLGLGFGWAAVYFTGFLAMMRGQTPGKRMLGIRVIRLDGKPLGWWIAFERFGGYAASFSVGLMGFFQILWDRNRQGLHDKACETVVIRSTPQPARS